MDQSHPTISAPVIQHLLSRMNQFTKVQILQPAPNPPPNSHAASALATYPFYFTCTHTSRKPIAAERILSVSDVVTIFFESLIQSAKDFLARKSSPCYALEKAPTHAGVHVL